MEEKTEGEIKFFNTDKGYGFITSEGKDIFFHISGFEEKVNDQEIKQGDKVEFEEAEGRQGPKAIRIKWVK